MQEAYGKDAKNPETLSNLITCGLHLGKNVQRYITWVTGCVGNSGDSGPGLLLGLWRTACNTCSVPGMLRGEWQQVVGLEATGVTAYTRLGINLSVRPHRLGCVRGMLQSVERNWLVMRSNSHS